MKVRAQIGKVLNLDKCIGCHTCSVTCKNVWTTREGVEYAWFNNVETKPGTGYPTDWENQKRWNGGWVRSASGKLHPKQGSKWRILANIFANPSMPEIDDYYEPFDFDYDHLKSAPDMTAFPTARPRSKITGERMEKIEKGPNWEEILGGEFAKRSQDYNFEDVQKEIYGEYENTFMMYLPRLCEHCLNPTCSASCPSGAIYKREEDGIVLIDQEKCRGWRMCISGCPYKKVYYNWESGKSEKCTFCYPRIESGQPTVCSETCVGRIRYLGVILYDADKIEAAASSERETDLYGAQLDVFLDPNDPEVIAAARRDGVPEDWIEAAKISPIWKMAMDWKVAFPLHPEYRTLPMVWYIPPLSPIQNAAEAGQIAMSDQMPDVRSLRIPVKYLANMLTAGDEEPIVHALERMSAMRLYMRALTVGGVRDEAIAARVGMSGRMIEDMYKVMAIAVYEDRFAIPTAHREQNEDGADIRGGCGFTDGNGCSTGETGKTSLFGGKKKSFALPLEVILMMDRTLKALSLMLSYPSVELQDAMPEFSAILGADPRIAPDTRAALEALADGLGQGDLFDVQESYVMLFDRSRTLSLNLFEHVHGESRDRGGAMVSLIETYRGGGFEPATTELPDHLPVLLEFLSTRPSSEAQETLADAAHILDALAGRLVRRESGYAAAFAALSQLAGAQADTNAVADMLAQPDDDPTDLAALDAVWEETEVTFGPDPNAGCPQVRDMLALMDEPALKAASAPTNLNRSA